MIVRRFSLGDGFWQATSISEFHWTLGGWGAHWDEIGHWTTGNRPRWACRRDTSAGVAAGEVLVEVLVAVPTNSSETALSAADS